MHRLVLIVLLAACGSAAPRSTNTVRYADTRLVVVNPDVHTFADADQPVFLVKGTYWLFDDGKWWRAPSPTARWTFVAKPPVPVRQIEQPFEYVHYKITRPGQQLETVAQNGEAVERAVETAPTKDPTSHPVRERQQSAIDPTVDPTTNN